MFRTRMIVTSVAAVAAVLAAAGASGNASTVPDSGAPESTSPATSESAGAALSLSLIGEQRISNLTMVGGTLVGGLSGISYNPETDSYVIISDDRSDNNPARFYDATLTFDDTTFEAVEVTGAHVFVQTDGTTYPNQSQAEAGKAGAVPDPEAIRVDPTDGSLWWTSEGSQVFGMPPVLTHADASGRALDVVALPEAFAATPDQEEMGIRNNKATEGLTFAADGQSLFGIMEGPLFQDGPLPTGDTGTLSRIVQFDLDGNVIAQYAYELDPLQAEPAGPDADFADNGATEILTVDDTTFLVIERSGIPQAEGPWKMYIRIYGVDISGATDISEVSSLAEATDVVPATKTLVVNFEDLGLEHVDNVEGLTWGPELPNGSRSIVAVSDNNFDETSVTQFFVFDAGPA